MHLFLTGCTWNSRRQHLAWAKSACCWWLSCNRRQPGRNLQAFKKFKCQHCWLSGASRTGAAWRFQECWCSCKIINYILMKLGEVLTFHIDMLYISNFVFHCWICFTRQWFGKNSTFIYHHAKPILSEEQIHLELCNLQQFSHHSCKFQWILIIMKFNVLLGLHLFSGKDKSLLRWGNAFFFLYTLLYSLNLVCWLNVNLNLNAIMNAMLKLLRVVRLTYLFTSQSLSKSNDKFSNKVFNCQLLK